MHHFILLFRCRDDLGIIQHVSSILTENLAHIDTIQQTCLKDEEEAYLFSRIQFHIKDLNSVPKLRSDFKVFLTRLNGYFHIKNTKDIAVMPIMCSRESHCLKELLYQWKEGSLNIKIPFIISNSDRHQELASFYGVPYHYIPVSTNDRKENEVLDLVKGSDTLILARYMQILSGDFIDAYGKDIINIHHSFLPSFKGSNPYKQALDYGVKIIGATTHYVTIDLDEGPIIKQAVIDISHEDSVQTLKTKGQHLEKITLLETVRLQADYRILRFRNKTVVFK